MYGNGILKMFSPINVTVANLLKIERYLASICDTQQASAACVDTKYGTDL